MNRTPETLSKLLLIALCASAAALAGCDRAPTESAASAVPAPAPVTPPAAEPVVPPVAVAPAATVAPAAPAVPVASAYVPPTADRLYELVAPIALYPDKLVAQVLAASTYPRQVTAADQWLAQNAALKAGPLADAAEQQAWDPSIKSLTAFRRVLDQLAKNLPWTTALGEVYYNDPDDVMNAVQVMRQRASRAGQLKTTAKLRVAMATTPARYYTPDPNAQAFYAGQPVIEPPPQYITIEPAQPDVVYVPAYDPQRSYGDPVAVYPGYAYAPPVYAAPGYGNAQVATIGALTFGAGVIVGAALERHDWGWHAWGMNWGRPDAYRGGNRPPGGPQALAAVDRPAVVYNRSTYISRSTTVVNNNVRNTVVNGMAPQQAQVLQSEERRQQAQIQQLQRQQGQQAQQAQQASMQQQQRARQQAIGQQAVQQQQHAQQDQLRRQQEAQQGRQQVQAQQAQAQQAQHQQQAQQRAVQTQHQQAQVQQQQAQAARQQQDRAQHQQMQQAQQQQAAQQAQARQQQAQHQAHQQQQQQQQQQQHQQHEQMQARQQQALAQTQHQQAQAQAQAQQAQQAHQQQAQRQAQQAQQHAQAQQARAQHEPRRQRPEQGAQ